MQKDEEVGKVAQGTPIVICMFWLSSLPVSADEMRVCPAKALEMFLALLIKEGSNVTIARRAKKVEVYHLCVPAFLIDCALTDSFCSLFLGFSLPMLHDIRPTLSLHLSTRKHAILTVEQLDFLKDLIEHIPDPSEGGAIDLSASASGSGSKANRSSTAGEDGPDVADGEEAPKKRKPRAKKEPKEPKEPKTKVPKEVDPDAPPKKTRRRKKKGAEEDMADADGFVNTSAAAVGAVGTAAGGDVEMRSTEENEDMEGEDDEYDEQPSGKGRARASATDEEEEDDEDWR
jgi:Dr1-associated corepressor